MLKELHQRDRTTPRVIYLRPLDSGGLIGGLVLRRGVTVSVAGLVVGLCCAWGFTRILTTLLFEISPADPVTFAFGLSLIHN